MDSNSERIPRASSTSPACTASQQAFNVCKPPGVLSIILATSVGELPSKSSWQTALISMSWQSPSPCPVAPITMSRGSHHHVLWCAGSVSVATKPFCPVRKPCCLISNCCSRSAKYRSTHQSPCFIDQMRNLICKLRSKKQNLSQPNESTKHSAFRPNIPM